MSNVSMQTDVLIVGAGPTGLAFACQLIRYGIDFVIIDKKENITKFSKAIGVQARTLELYEQIGLAAPMVAEGLPARGVRMVEGGEVRAEVPLSELGKGVSPYPYMLVLEQGIHERVLYNFIKSHNKDVLWQMTLDEFSQDDTGVSGTITSVSGESQSIEAKYLVACDGARSSVRIGLGLTFEGSTFERTFYVADVHVKWEFPHDFLVTCLSTDRSVAFFPMVGENRYRIVGVFPDEFDKEPSDVVYEEIERQTREDSQLDFDIYDVNWFSTYKVHSRRVNKFSEGRCFLAGDAAHIHTPAGGQGMNTGIQDGYNLAWKLALVLRGNAKPELLGTYNEERIENAKRLLETTDRMFDLLVNPAAIPAFVRTRIFPYVANFALSFDAVKQFVFPLISQTGINYRKSSLSAEDRNFEIKPGDRMPYFLIDAKSVYDWLHEPAFHLIVFSDTSSRGREAIEDVKRECAGLIECVCLPLQNAAEVFGTNEPFSVLLRPDNYIAYISSGTSLDDLKAYLENVIGRNEQSQSNQPKVQRFSRH